MCHARFLITLFKLCWRVLKNWNIHFLYLNSSISTTFSLVLFSLLSKKDDNFSFSSALHLEPIQQYKDPLTVNIINFNPRHSEASPPTDSSVPNKKKGMSVFSYLLSSQKESAVNVKPLFENLTELAQHQV